MEIGQKKDKSLMYFDTDNFEEKSMWVAVLWVLSVEYLVKENLSSPKQHLPNKEETEKENQMPGNLVTSPLAALEYSRTL